MEKTIISIIVPIYNGEQYIKRCLDSVVNQTNINYRVIIVDDGSTDGTAEICKNYINKHSNIEYYYQPNSGEGAARNLGLMYCKTEFVTFLDCDDELSTDAISLYLENIKNCDLAIGGILKKGQAFESLHLPENHNVVGKQEIANTVIKEMYYLNIVCCKVFRTDIIKKYNIAFSDYKYGEDTYFMYHYLRFVKKICFFDKISYVIHEEKGSMSLRPVPEIWEYMKSLYELGKEIDSSNEFLDYMLLLRSIKTSLLLKMRETKNAFIVTSDIIREYIDTYSRPLSVKKGVYNNIIFFSIKKKKYILLWLILKLRIDLGLL